MQGRGRPKDSGPLDGEGRRSVYQAIRRNFLPPMMLGFDMPIPFAAMGKRNVSNVPTQSLTLMNDPFVHLMKEKWALNLLSGELDPKARIRLAYRQAFSREASELEIQLGLAFLEEEAGRQGCEENWDQEFHLWEEYLHSLMMSKEFIFLI